MPKSFQVSRWAQILGRDDAQSWLLEQHVRSSAIQPGGEVKDAHDEGPFVFEHFTGASHRLCEKGRAVTSADGFQNQPQSEKGTHSISKIVRRPPRSRINRRPSFRWSG